MAIGNIRISGSIPGIPGGQGAYALRKTGTPFAGNGSVGEVPEPYDLRLRGSTKEFNELSSIKARLNEVAREIKESENRRDLIERLKTSLGNINKFFPPYPPGDEERVKLLKGYVAFRVLIERLTIPPETDNLEQALEMSDKRAEEMSIEARDGLSNGQGKITHNASLADAL